MLTNPYENTDERLTAKFNSLCPQSVLNEFRAYFPRRGVIQSFVNHIIYETIKHIKSDGRIEYASAGNEQHLEHVVDLLRLSLKGRTYHPPYRSPITLNEYRAITALCTNSESSPNDTTDIPKQTNERKRRIKRSEQS